MSDSNVTSFRKKQLEGLDDATEWTPREALQRVMDQIDNGEFEVDEIVICYNGKFTDREYDEDGGNTYTYSRAGKECTKYSSVGLIEFVKNLLISV